MSNVSAWGIDHGTEEIAKAENKGFTRNEKLTGAATALTYNSPIGAIAAGAQAKKGQRLKVGAKAGGRGFLQGAAGAGVGGAVGAKLGGVRGAQTGMVLGGAPTTAHGVMASMRNSRRKGQMK